MSILDWWVLGSTLVIITLYGIYHSRKQNNLDEYLLDNQSAKWWTVGLSVMATQASAITFLSTPGQAFTDGMRFVQFYFGLPIAIIIICITFIPRYRSLKVFTAYQFLEERFDLRTRLLTAFLFLIQRGLAAGITIYAPAIVLSSVLNVSLHSMVLLIGGLVILYTVLGGTRAVNVTQKYQMLIIFTGLFTVFFIVLDRLPTGLSFNETLEIAGIGGKMQILDFSWNLNDRYTFWTGILGGSFLALSYFGTDQSQVQRYLSGKSIQESRFGLIFNALFKVPMQFFILLVGIMVFIFYQYNPSPIFFNSPTKEAVYETSYNEEFRELENRWNANINQRKELIEAYNSDASEQSKNIIKTALIEEQSLRIEAKEIIKKALPDAESNDKDYIFIYFILNNLPRGLIGLLLAVFFCAAMSSSASELNALASISLVDIYKRVVKKDESEQHYVMSAKMLTIFWGGVAITFASVASLFENLIQFVNIIGSIFYGTILGIFVVAFYFKKIKAQAIFYAAIISELIVIFIFYNDWVAFLWLNFIGCLLVIVISSTLDLFAIKKSE